MGSWIPSLWGDEAASAMSAQRSIPSLLAMLTHVDLVHGSYYLALHFWVSVFGASPFSLRLPSAVAIGFTTAAVVLIALRLGTVRVAVAAGIICAVIPRVTYMGEEARSYAFSAAFAAWLTLVLIELLRCNGRSRRLWIAYGLLLAVGTYAFLYVVLFAAAHALILVFSRLPGDAGRRFFRTWFRVTLAAVVAASPIIVGAVLERGQIAYLAGSPQLGFTTVTVGLWFGSAEFAIAAWALLLVAGAHGVGILVRLRRLPRHGDDPVPPGQSPPTGPRLDVVAAVWLVIPSTVLIASHFFLADFTARYLSFCAPAAALLMAVALDWLSARRRLVLAAGVATIVVLATPAYLGQRQPYSKNNSDWANISATLAQNASPGDGVVFDETARPYRRTRLAMHTYPAGFTGLVDVALKTPYQRNDTWYDSAYSVDHALALGRFDGIDTVWVIELKVGAATDTYGLAVLESAGFTTRRTIPGHLSVIYELRR
jgi:mannosyltransferase